MLKAYDQMSMVVNSASNKSIESINRIQARMKALSQQAEHFGRQSLANGVIATAAALKPVQAFMELEDATTDLKVAMMDNLGNIPRQFDAIIRQAIQLGNILPGTTADFVGVARALQEQGTGMDTVLNGGLKAASYLSVLLKLPGAEAGEMVAKLREAYGLADNELEKMADLVQRARFAFGMTPQDIKIASSYSGATQNILGLKGLENAKQLMALQGLGAGVSLEGSSWGTNFSMMLNRMAESKDKLMKNSKEMKAVNADLKAAGINLEFFNAKGDFAGLQNMVQQLEKLNKLSQVDKLNALHKLFGAEAARPAAIIGQAGMAGFNEAIAKMDRQASLQQRIELSLGTMRNTWDALAGTATNALAMIGEPLAHGVYPYIVKLNELIGGPMMAWIEQHQRLVGVMGAAVLLFGLAAVSLGALGLAASAMLHGVSAMLGLWRGGLAVWRLAAAGIGLVRGQLVGLMVAQRAQMAVQALQNAVAYRGGVWGALQYALLTTKYRILEGIGVMRAWVVSSALWARGNLLSLAGLRGLTRVLAGGLLNALKAAALGVRAFGLALLTNPIAWIVAIIAGGALLIYRNWKPISSFFTGLWSGLKAGFGPLAPAFKAIGNILGSVFKPVLGPLKAVWNWLAGLFTQTDNNGKAAKKLGFEWGKAIGEMLKSAVKWGVRMAVEIAKVVLYFKEAAGKFYDAGAEIMAGLWRGIQSKASMVLDGITSIAGKVAGAFKGALGIHSPSRVFMGFGENISQGAALGIMSARQRAVQAANDMAAGVAGAAGKAHVVPFPRTVPQIYGPVPDSGRAGGAGGPAAGMVVHFSPTINVQGGAGQGVKEQVQEGLKLSLREFEQMLERVEAGRKRRTF